MGGSRVALLLGVASLLAVEFACAVQQQQHPILVLVNTRVHTLSHVGLAAARTWAPDLPADVGFVLPATDNARPSHAIELDDALLLLTCHNCFLIRVPNTTAAYPPREKYFLMLQIAYRRYFQKYEWFFKVDDDTYINPLVFSDAVVPALAATNASYLGMPGMGRISEQEKLGLAVPYCLGMCVGAPCRSG
jgi:hypothetical protein